MSNFQARCLIIVCQLTMPTASPFAAGIAMGSSRDTGPHGCSVPGVAISRGKGISNRLSFTVETAAMSAATRTLTMAGCMTSNRRGVRGPPRSSRCSSAHYRNYPPKTQDLRRLRMWVAPVLIHLSSTSYAHYVSYLAVVSLWLIQDQLPVSC